MRSRVTWIDKSAAKLEKGGYACIALFSPGFFTRSTIVLNVSTADIKEPAARNCQAKK
jgi:hypothetical protein